jgi:peptidoglycan-associated lipoprotein
MKAKLLVTVIVALTVALAGCGSTKKDKDKGAADAQTSGVGDGGQTSGQGLFAGGDLLSKKVVYFEFDSSAITAESREIIRAHAEHLGKTGNTKIVLEGHADERGTREYNLALGERRAKAVKEAFAAYGVAPGSVQTISYGEERPVALEHNDAAWQLNRRVEIIY